MSDVFARIRAAAEQVAARARQVRIDEAGLTALCARIAADPPGAAQGDPAHHAFPDPQHTLAYVVSLDAINFGSGWFPFLRKPEGRSGYFTIATALRACSSGTARTAAAPNRCSAALASSLSRRRDAAS